MSKTSDVRPIGAQLFLLPVEMRMPLKFGRETITHAVCARVKMRVTDRAGKRADGWGETPLSVTWAWPSTMSYDTRFQAMTDLCAALTEAWSGFEEQGHPLEIGSHFLAERLPALVKRRDRSRGQKPMPWLTALVCCSAFDLALHDAYGKALGLPTYHTYNAEYMSQDLGAYLTPAEETRISFAGKYPAEYLRPRQEQLSAWHLVGGKDPLHPGELTGEEPKDEYPVLLADWIARDGLTCLKVKLRGDDALWDYERLVQVGKIGQAGGVVWLTADFNCTVTDPVYVTEILDRLMVEHPTIWQQILYVEQPFPYELEENRIDVHCVSARKPLFMDESAHDWRMVKLGRTLGWTGVALKTCKTQTGAILSLCWARAHGMTLMVQDLTNPMLAQVPHLLLAAHAGTIMGVETNGMQFCPAASIPEATVHPNLYRRRGGQVDLTTLNGPGFGYAGAELARTLPAPVASAGDIQ